MAWVGGIDVVPGFRVIPESDIYTVRKEHTDLLVFDDQGILHRCCAVVKFNRDELNCLDPELIGERLVELVRERFGVGLQKVLYAKKGVLSLWWRPLSLENP